MRLIIQEILLNFSIPNRLVSTLAFFLIFISVFPFAYGSDQLTYRVPAILLSVIFVNLLTTSNIFQEDYEDGTLEQLYVASIPIWNILLSKIICHFLFVILPIIFSIAIICFAFKYDLIQILYLCFVMMLLNILISIIGIFGAILTNLISKGYLISVAITLPFTISANIFTALSMKYIMSNQYNIEFFLYIKILLSICCILIPVFIFFICEMISELLNPVDIKAL